MSLSIKWEQHEHHLQPKLCGVDIIIGQMPPPEADGCCDEHLKPNSNLFDEKVMAVEIR